MNKNNFPLRFHSSRGFSLFLVLFALSFFLCAGCDFRRVVVNQSVDLQTLRKLNPGKSSLQEVVKILGSPDTITGQSDGMVLRYRFGDAKTLRVNFGWIFRFFLPVAPSMNLGRGEEVPEILHIALNQDNVFDRYLLQQPLDPPQFSFWPF